jgi:8-oxo-dGTP diphosphatase
MKQKNRPQVGVGLMILNKKGEVLLGKRQGAHGENTYGWIGGHLEFGETPEKCLIREAQEEIGCQVKIHRLICVSNIVKYDKHYLDLEFLGEITQGTPKVMEPDKVVSWQWHALNHLPQPLFEAVALGIKSYHNQHMYNA